MLRDRKFADSSLEEAGFEPSVPRGAIQVSRGAHLDSAGFSANRKVGANENRHHDDAVRRPRDRWFESGPLQRRVCELSVPIDTNAGTGRRLWPAILK